MKKNKKDKLNVKAFKSKFNFKISMIIGIIIFLVFIGISVFTITNKFNKKVYKNIYLNGVDLSNYTMSELQEYIEELSENNKENAKVLINQNNKKIDELIPSEVDFEIDLEKTKEQVYNCGRSGNIFENNLAIIGLMFKKQDFNIKYSINGKKLNEKIVILQDFLDNAVVNDKWELDEKNHTLIITKGKKGDVINLEETKETLASLLKESQLKEYELPVSEKEVEKVDVEEIYEQVHRKPVDAEIKYDENKKPIFIKEIYGLDFDKKELQKKIDETKEEGSIIKYKLDVSAPLTRFEDIAWTKFDDVLASATTYYAVENKSKASNINISSTYINEKIIMPGEVFSFNNTIGEPTKDKGYEIAGVYMGSEIVNGIGGGICQTVSTLYNAALYANLEIISRSNHAMVVSYVRPSLDATMYYPYLDFKFKNNRNFPIKIKTAFSWAGNINISIMGTKEDNTEVRLESNKIAEKEYTTKKIIDNTLEPGKQFVKQVGVNGYTSEAYRIVTKDGMEIKRELLSRDTYKPIEKIIIVGPDENVVNKEEENIND